MHAFEKHQHEICFSKDAQHFHQRDIDCSLLHTQSLHTIMYTPSSEVVRVEFGEAPLPFYDVNHRPQKYLHHHTLRGPPSC